MGSRKKKNKRDKKKRSRRTRPRLPALPPNMRVVMAPAGREKMSEVLAEFIEPWGDSWQTVEQLKNLLGVAVIAWNAALMPVIEREALFRDTMSTIPAQGAILFRTLLDEMIQRKVTHFANNKRFIISFEVTMKAQGPYIRVTSTLDTP